MADLDDSARAVESWLEELGRLSREAFARRPIVDMSPRAVMRRLARVSQARDLCLYLMRLGRASGLHDREIGAPGS